MNTQPQTLSKPASAAGLLFFAAATSSAVALGGSAESGRSRWYRRLRKPPYQPPNWVFAPVWTVLYSLIAVSGWRVWKRKSAPGRGPALVLWGTQLVFNGLWSHLFFRQRNPRAALGDIGLLLGSIALYTVAARRVDKVSAGLMAPYLGWVSFATALNAEIVRRNPSV